MIPVPQLPDNAPFDESQRQWLNGYLAGLLARSVTLELATTGAPAPVVATEPLLIAFGSQTGTAEGLARKVAKAAKAKHFAPEVICLESLASPDLAKHSKVLLITSTYGDGEPPDNAAAFWNYLSSAEAPKLDQTRFSVLALGDTNYEKFCAFGQACDRRFEELGAQRVVPRVDCDLDYDAPFAGWMEASLAALNGGSSSIQDSAPAISTQDSSEETKDSGPIPYGKKNPFPARLLVNRLLNAPGSGKEVRHFEISLANSGLVYEAGDALGVIPSNCPELVESILTALHFTGEEFIPHAGDFLSIRHALTHTFDLNKPGKELLAALVKVVPDSKLAPLLAGDRSADLQKYLYGRDVLDMLTGHPTFRPTPTDLVLLLKTLQPRLYSISSSPKAHPDEVHLTVAAVRYTSHERARKGVCSTFLAERCLADTPLPVFVHNSPGFRVPKDASAPMIMIGPGTGIAPFRAFLEERAAIGATGKNWLFFGDQKRSSDFYYEEQLTEYQNSGFLTRLDTAFSRDQAEKIYVQHRMIEHGAEFWKWLEEGGHIYVCGDASRMAKDVDNALRQIIQTQGNRDTEAADAYVNQLKQQKRYQRDVY